MKYLTEICDSIIAGLNGSDSSNWGGPEDPQTGYIVGSGQNLTAKFALDPFSDATDKSGLNIFVTPGYAEFSFENKRAGPLHSRPLKYVTVTLSVPVDGATGTPEYDVTTEEEGKKLSWLKEELDNFLVKLVITGAELQAAESEPFDELEMKSKFFIAPIVLGYRAC